ncbi:Uncharacterized protein Fot_09115 [Forsythia ovata]|uniref:Uncharacterized protein n=1 Tax=Forsythia ovata TaxID=205694 RepID=A0ABD1WDM6_9LAMI
MAVGRKMKWMTQMKKKLIKETVHKYLKMVKPLYICVSKRYEEKLKFSGHLSFSGGETKGGAAPTPQCTVKEKRGDGAVSERGGIEQCEKQENKGIICKQGLKGA